MVSNLEFPIPSLPMSLYCPSHLDNSTVTQPPYWGMQRMSAVVSVHLKPNLILFISVSFHSSFNKPESQSQKCWWYYTSNGAGFVMLSLRSCSVRITQRE